MRHSTLPAWRPIVVAGGLLPLGLALGLVRCTSAGTADECTVTSECGTGQVCIEGQCRTLCNNDSECGSNEVCFDGVCEAGDGQPTGGSGGGAAGSGGG